MMGSSLGVNKVKNVHIQPKLGTGAGQKDLIKEKGKHLFAQ